MGGNSWQIDSISWFDTGHHFCVATILLSAGVQKIIWPFSYAFLFFRNFSVKLCELGNILADMPKTNHHEPSV